MWIGDDAEKSSIQVHDFQLATEIVTRLRGPISSEGVPHSYAYLEKEIITMSGTLIVSSLNADP